MRQRPHPLAVLALAALLTGCVSVPPAPSAPRHQPAGQSAPLPRAPSAAPSPPAQPRGLEELAWIGPSPTTPATADRKPRKEPAAQQVQPRRAAPAPGRVRPAYPRKRTPAPPRTTKRWVPSPPRVPTGGGMRSVCRSAQGIVSPGLAGMCRSVGR
ncbi:hypothetical protein ACFC3O_33650 [Streptomyces sp. NPDC056007]|uniref:hypothetical protein n=1 Tax=Streptomyces sp. NPDC056007 TaxID=3345678 RepID=UPI0035DF16F7